MSKAKQQARQTEIVRRAQAELGDEIICDVCRCTYLTYADDCIAEFSQRCPGFNRYDEVRCKHEREVKP